MYGTLLNNRPSRKRDSNLNVAQFDQLELDMLVFYHTNQLRRSYNLNYLLTDNNLRKSALLHCTEMKEKSFFAHENPVTNRLKTPLQRIQVYSNYFIGVGENLASIPLYKDNFITIRTHSIIGFPVRTERFIDTSKSHSYQSMAVAAVNGWLNSPPHRKIMLSPSFTHLGCGSIITIKECDGLRIPYLLLTQNYGYIH